MAALLKQSKTAIQAGGSHENPVRRGPVVLATDGSSRYGAVVVAARLLASRLDLPLEVVSVLEPDTGYSTPPQLDVPSTPEILEGRRDTREMAVSDYVCRYSGGATPARIHVRSGNVATEIARFAREVSATIIVVGSAPHRRFRHWISGARAAQVLRSADCPVLSVPPSFTEFPRTAVVAVDFGPSSVRAAQAALLVIGDNGTVVLTHVLPPLLRPAALSIPRDAAATTDVRLMFDRLRTELGPAVPRGVKLETRLVTDDPATGILASAEPTGAQLIAVGTQGPGLLSRLLLGSVAESVLHDAEEAVVASPPPPAPEALDLWRRITGVASSTHDRDWGASLDSFTRRNVGRTVLLEVDDPETGARVTGHGYTLMGVTYEPAAHCVEIMVGDAVRPLQHLTRWVVHPDAITMTGTPTGEVLDIRHGRGHTIAAVASASQ
jgi:nucleotide-binding universal stress UspA family protein